MADDKTKFFKVTGTVEKITNPDYGNMVLKDETGKMVVYGVYSGYGAKGDARKGLVKAVGLEVGDQLTIIGAKSSFNSKPQLVNSFYVSHKKP